MNFKNLSFLFSLSALVYCGSPTTNSETNKDIFHYNISSGITTLDPAFARNIENISVVNHMFNGLVEMDADLNIKPSIASDWEISEDGLVYTFFLRRDVYFHDHEAFRGGKGRKVTATDFVYSFERLLDPKTASPGAWIFSNIDQGRTGHLGFEALEKYTLRIYLKEAFQPFLGLLTMKYCSVIPHEVVEELGDGFRKNPVGTGPFKFQLWKEGNKLILRKNENYFENSDGDEKIPKLDAVSISFINDEEVEYLEFLKGNLDFLKGTTSSNREFLDHNGQLKEKYVERFRYLNEPYLNTEYLGVMYDSTLDCMKKNPLNNVLVRRAMNMAFDRVAMIKYLNNGVGTPALEGFIPKGMPPFKNGWVSGYQFDPDSARSLMQEAGYDEGIKGIKLYTTSQYLTLCEYVQGQWGEIGIKVDIELNPAATIRELIALSKIPFFRKSWVADYPSAENYLALFYSGNFSPAGPNYTHFRNNEYDKLYEEARVELNDSIRYDFYRRMEEIILEESVVIPLYYDEVVRYVHFDVKNLFGNPMNLLDLRMVEIEK